MTEFAQSAKNSLSQQTVAVYVLLGCQLVLVLSTSLHSVLLSGPSAALPRGGVARGALVPSPLLKGALPLRSFYPGRPELW